MEIQKIISALKGENELMLFDPSTGEMGIPEMLNETDRSFYDVHVAAIEELKKYEWKVIAVDGLPPIGQPLIVTVKDNFMGLSNQLRYPVYYGKDAITDRYSWKWILEDRVNELVPEVSEVIAWKLLPEPCIGSLRKD